MAKVTGISCDVCGKFEKTSNEAALPDGWIQVFLPHTNNANMNDYKRELCGNRCMVALGKDRMKAMGEDTPRGTRGKSKFDEGLREFLISKGVKPAGMGGTTMSHIRDKHEQTRPRPGCLVCQYLEGGGEIKGLDRDTD